MTCDTESPIENAEENVPVTLAYTTVQATEALAPQARGIARAAQNLNEGTFASGEAITVRISNTGADTWVDYAFTTGTDGAMTPPEPAPYYPAGSQNIDIAAYYPADAGTTFSVATNQVSDASYKASDLMFAFVTNQAKQVAPVNLAFSHNMAKLCVNITAGQGVANIISVSILNVKPTVSFDQATGAVGSASGDATTIAMSNNGAAVIPAQTINGGLLSIVTDKGTATYSVTNKEFVAGNKYTLNITVNLHAVGTTTEITGWTSEGTVTLNPVSNTPAGIVAVDMGNGLKWANMNVGARTETDYGDYFAWGATMPFYVDHDAYGNAITGQWLAGKTGYNWASYPFLNSAPEADFYHINKYTFDDGQYETGVDWYSTGGTFIGDGKTSFADYNYVDDAARQNWGGTWRTPTDTEWNWLRNNCTWEWKTTDNGYAHDGMLVTSNIPGYTANSIFLPSAGYREGVRLECQGTFGLYWSSSLGDETKNAGAMFFVNAGETYLLNGASREHGYTIRPVME